MGAAIDPRNTFEAQKLGIGTVYQEVNLLDNLTVAYNLFLGRQPRRFGEGGAPFACVATRPAVLPLAGVEAVADQPGAVRQQLPDRRRREIPPMRHAPICAASAQTQQTYPPATPPVFFAR